MRVLHDPLQCDAHGQCVALCPEVFMLDDDDELQVLMEFPPDALFAEVRAAVAACPKLALRTEG